MYGNLYLEYNSLVSLVMQNKAEKVIDLLETESVDMRILNDIGCSKYPLPLYKLSLCNAILLDSDNWSESFLPVLEKRRLKAGQMPNAASYRIVPFNRQSVSLRQIAIKFSSAASKGAFMPYLLAGT